MRQGDDHARTRNPVTIRKNAPRPRTKPAETRRDELLAAATVLFVAKGVGPTTIDEIAARADVAKGTVYIYFPSKDDLVSCPHPRGDRGAAGGGLDGPAGRLRPRRH